MANTSLRLIAAQEKHIKILQEKLEKIKEEQILRFTSTPGWPLFILRNSSSYNRRIQSGNCGYLNWAHNCKVSIETDDTNAYITCRGSQCYIKTNNISIDELDKFIENSEYDSIVEYSNSHFWSSYSKWYSTPCTSGEKGYNSMILYASSIKNLSKFLEGSSPILTDDFKVK